MVGVRKQIRKELDMHNFNYVSKKQLSLTKSELISIINTVQDLLREDFTFQYYFVGSVKNNMVTYNAGTNIGFDFDVNIEVNDDDCNFSPKEIKEKLKNALDHVVLKYEYDYAENSTRVLTIKFKDRQHSKIIHSCDFAIVNNYCDKNGVPKQEYIRYSKSLQSYSWVEQSNGYYMLPNKVAWIKDNGYWNETRALYLHKKNYNNDYNKH